MAIGDAASKTMTYGDVVDLVRLETNTIDDSKISDALILKRISVAVQKYNKLLNGASVRQHTTTNSTLTISGTANPYTVDLSSVAPFVDRIIKVTHVTTGGVRTLVKVYPSEEVERIIKLTTVQSSSIFAVDEGDALRLYVGTGFTITTASDTVEIKYLRHAKVGSTSSAAVVSDTAWTSASTTITAFTGMTAALVGGTFVGLDNGGNAFARTITQYVSATSFLISSALVADGAGTNGYIIPPNSNTYTVTTGTYLDIEDCYVSLIIDEVSGVIARHKQNGQVDPNRRAMMDAEQQQIMQAYQMNKVATKE